MLDILSPKGQETLAQELRAVEIFNYYNSDTYYAPTPKHMPAIVDAVLVDKTGAIGLVETKCRMMTHKKLKEYGGEWLITWDKIKKAKELSVGCGIPLFGFLYLVPDDILLMEKISDGTGKMLVEIRVASTRTQATVNGGSVVRENVYINMNAATVMTGISNE